jgi:hypothetical protein
MRGSAARWVVEAEEEVEVVVAVEAEVLPLRIR